MMGFWITAILLTAFGLAAILLPMMRRKGENENSARYDQEVYKAQLTEVERDLAQGTISAQEVQASRAEIARRLLNADRAVSQADENPTTASHGRWAFVVAAIMIPAIAIGFYGFRGQPGLPGQPHAERKAETRQPGDLGTMAQGLARQLEANPDNLDGWTLLARSYLSLGQFQKSVAAFEKALGLDRGNTDLLSTYGEALFLAAGRVVTPAARATFQTVYEKAPQEPRARFYLALASAQAGKLKEAHAAWKSLIADAPPNAAYLPTVIAQANRVGKAIGAPLIATPQTPTAPSRPTGPAHPATDTEPAQARGPSTEDMKAAAQMSSDDRNQMIEGMVARLAGRLKEQPSDLKGWMRLANAYRVLGKTKEQADALGQAAALAPKNVDILLLYGRTLRSVSGNRQTPQSIAVMRQILGIEPNNLEALFLVGRAEVNAGRTAQGRALMQKALDQIPPGAKERVELQKQIEALRENRGEK